MRRQMPRLEQFLEDEKHPARRSVPHTCRCNMTCVLTHVLCQPRLRRRSWQRYERSRDSAGGVHGPTAPSARVANPTGAPHLSALAGKPRSLPPEPPQLVLPSRDSDVALCASPVPGPGWTTVASEERVPCVACRCFSPFWPCGRPAVRSCVPGAPLASPFATACALRSTTAEAQTRRAVSHRARDSCRSCDNRSGGRRRRHPGRLPQRGRLRNVRSAAEPQRPVRGQRRHRPRRSDRATAGLRPPPDGALAGRRAAPQGRSPSGRAHLPLGPYELRRERRYFAEHDGSLRLDATAIMSAAPPGSVADITVVVVDGAILLDPTLVAAAPQPRDRGRERRRAAHELLGARLAQEERSGDTGGAGRGGGPGGLRG